MRFWNEDMHQRKNYYDGTHRAREPEETLEWLLPIARHAGVTRVANVTGLDVLRIPVWIAIRPNARGLSTSQGKGLSDAAARASAVMESVENWHGETIESPLQYGDFAAMQRRGKAVDPESVPYYEDSPPRRDVAFPWIQAFDLVSQEPCWVPFEYVSTDYVVKGDRSLRSTFVQSSNGLAGGNHLLEAMEHGLCELIERHALSIEMDRIRSFDPSIRVELQSITDAFCLELIRRIHAAGVQAAVFSLPSGLGIPVFAASILEGDGQKRWKSLPPFNGYGCHLDPAIALARALTEAVQSRLTYISGSRDDIVMAEYNRGGNPDDAKGYQALFERPAWLNFPERATPFHQNFEDDLQYLVGNLVRHGYIQVLMVDLSKGDLGVPVVKAVVPGLGSPNALIRGRAIHLPERREARAQ